jgi:hypothetical protein
MKKIKSDKMLQLISEYFIQSTIVRIKLFRSESLSEGGLSTWCHNRFVVSFVVALTFGRGTD